MTDFDKGARFGARRLHAEGFLRWLLRENFWAAWRWRDWLDTQAVPFPGEADRRLDTVAAFDRRAGDRPPLAVVVEFMTQPRRIVLERLAEYTLRLRREYPYSTDPHVPYAVIGVLVNLSGSMDSDEWSMEPDDCDEVGLWSKAGLRNLSAMDAATELARIASGTTAKCVLPWIALMRGAGEQAIRTEWKRLAETEPDAEKRRDYAGLAKVFADLAGHLPLWETLLEGWNVERSKVTLEWEARAELRATRANLLRFLRGKFGTPVPADLDQAVQTQTDLAILNDWVEHVGGAADISKVRSAFGLSEE